MKDIIIDGEIIPSKFFNSWIKGVRPGDHGEIQKLIEKALTELDVPEVQTVQGEVVEVG